MSPILHPTKLNKLYDINVIESRCNWLKNYKNNQRTATEPEWYAVLRLVKHTKNDTLPPQEVAKEFSSGHKLYNEEDTLKILEQIEERQPSPTTCKDFQKFHKKRCDGCRYAPWITSPLLLGNIEIPNIDSPDFTEEVIHPDGTIEEVKVLVPKPPDPYYRAEEGGIYLYSADGAGSSRIFEYDIFPVRRLKDEESGNENIEISLQLPKDGRQIIKIPSSYLHDHRKLIAALSEKGALVRPCEVAALQAYLIEYTKLLQKAEPAHEEFARFGWRDLDTYNARFVLGDFVLSQKGELRRSTPALHLHQFREICSAKGDLNKWREAFDVYNKIPNDAYRFTQMLGFAAPLFVFTPFHGLIYNMVGESGCGKSTALRMMTSIWGKPNERHIQVQDNRIPVQNIIGALQNIPISWDELTTINSEALVDMAYAISEGRGKHRASETGKTTKNIVHWKTLVCGASNLSLYEKLGMSRSGNNAHAYRIFEVPVESATEKHRKLIDQSMISIENNYGCAGRIYIAYVIRNIPAIKEMLEEVTQSYTEQYRMITAERYWYTLFACVAVGGSIAKKLELHEYDVDGVIDWGASQLQSLRKIIKTVEGDALSFLSQFIQTHLHQTLHVHDDQSFFNDSNELNVRIEWFNKKPMRAYISLHAIRDFCTKQNIEYTWFSRRLKEYRILTDAKISKSLGKGTPLMTGLVSTWELDLTKMPLEESILNKLAIH